MCAAQVLACSPRERNDSKQNKRVPNFLIDTILNKIPHDTTAPMVSPSASMLLGRQSFDMQRERALLAYAHQLTRWGVWIQTAKATSSQYATSLKSTLHKNKTKETKVWNPIHSYSDHLTSEGGSTTDEDENHIGKLRQMSNVLAKEENEVAATGKIDVQKIATANLTNLQNEKKLNSNEAKEVKNQALWPAWVYCTRYSNRPSAGPRTRKNQRKNRLSKTDGNDDKRARTVFSPEQLDELQREFNESQYLTGERRVRLANNLGLTMAQIKVWFQNKRAKVKKNSGAQNVLAMQLRAQGLYDHSTYSASNNTNTIIATTNNSHNEQEKI